MTLLIWSKGKNTYNKHYLNKYSLKGKIQTQNKRKVNLHAKFPFIQQLLFSPYYMIGPGHRAVSKTDIAPTYRAHKQEGREALHKSINK